MPPDTKAGVAWQDPPEEPGKPDWSAVAATLRRHPMRWRKVYEQGRTSWKEAVSQGHVAAVHPRLGFETRTSDNTRGDPLSGEPRRCTLFMRYNPDLVDDVAELVATRKKD